MELKSIIFNPSYGLKHDIKRTYLYTRENPNDLVDINHEWLSVIHPMYAMLLALLSTPKTYDDAIEEISHFFDISKSTGKELLDKLYGQREPFHSKFDGVVSQFPKNILIPYNSNLKFIEYEPEEFKYKEIDMITQRALDTPRTVVFMPTGRCSVQCLYCYADRRKHSFMSFDQVKSFIADCKNNRIFSIFLTGGDLLLYPFWKELIEELRFNNFDTSFISSKTPGDEEDISFMKKNKIFLQFSLDSANITTLNKLIHARSEYLHEVEDYFTCLSKENVEFRVATVLTELNSSIEELKSLYSFISQFSSLKSWTIRCAMKSLYSNAAFNTVKLSSEQIEDIDNLLKQLKDKSFFEISYDLKPEDKYFKGENGSPSFKSARCSANYSNIMVLPDGKVTICEQLYWNPNYIIGDVTEQNLHEIWNSKKALSLSIRCREDLQPSNPCKTCDLLDKCNSFPNRCITDVIKAYGEENSDYPDPRCAKAPKPKHRF